MPLTYQQRKLAEALGEGVAHFQTSQFCNGYVVALLTVREHLCGIGESFNEQAAFEFDKYTKINDWRAKADS